MKTFQLARRGAKTAAVIAGGLVMGFAAQEALAALTAPTPKEEWGQLEQEHSDSAYDAAMKRFVGKAPAPLRAAVQALPFDHTVLAVVTGGDLGSCEDLGRQLRELSRAVPDQPGWGMAILVDQAGMAGLRVFLQRERVGRIPILVGDPRAYVEGQEHPGTPAAVVMHRDGSITAGVSHPLRVRNTRSRSFAEELGLAGTPGTDLTVAGARRPSLTTTTPGDAK